MKVKLISYSKPTEEVSDEGISDAQELVAFCARVSNPSNQLNTETSEKLITYLIKNAHWSPLEMVSACLEIETTRDTDNSEIVNEWTSKQNEVIEAATNAYNWAIDSGIAKEQARSVLPEGNTVSRLYMNGTLRSWIHYIELRAGNGTQKEHMEIAKACAEVIHNIFPMGENLN
jgi:thymidylate synthase (FAD)